MATSGSSSQDLPPHGKTEVVQKFTAADYGPLSTFDQCDNFRGGSYQLTTPTGGGLVLYRLYGGTGPRAAREDGQYWSAERRDGNQSYAMDFAVLPQWPNTLEKEATLFVPPGIFLFEGYASPQHPHADHGRRDYGYLGGNWQVFIPNAVVGPLLKAQKATTGGNQGDIQRHVQEAMSAQRSYMEEYDRIVREKSEKQLNDFCTLQNAQRFMKNGNALGSLPQSVKKALTSDSTAVTSTSGSSETMPTGTHVVHRETIQLFNGANVTVSLHVRIEFSHETKRVFQSGNTTTTEITRYYKRIFEWQ